MRWDMQNYDVVIIGAGAAGMLCAIEAGRRGRRVLLIDHAKVPGEKIRISGGGRCNFTNLHIAPEKFLSGNPRFALSALARFTQWDFIAMVDAAGIAWHEKTLGQLFCDGSSRQIIDMLMRAMIDAGVELRLQTEVAGISKGQGYELTLTSGQVTCGSLVIATGGKSIPKMGATGFGYRAAEQFGVPVTETRPALVPLTFAEQDLGPIKAMAGTSVFASVRCGAAVFDEGLLFTHRGLSGPSILQISSYWREGQSISVDLSPVFAIKPALAEARGKSGRMAVATALAAHLPKAVAQDAVARAGLTGNLADQSDKALDQLADAVHRWTLKPVGSEGYRTAEVTLGGVDTDALDAKTMQVKSVPGLHFIGEVVDVTGWLGGYNFQWAWSSGWAAGQVV
jgi:predicted Rossmann fold flavoprotein